MKTQNIIDKFRLILKQALNNYINELMNDKIQSALSDDTKEVELINDVIEEQLSKQTKEIVTTDEELEAYFIIKNLVKDIVPLEDITYRDTVNYINILYKDNGRKWICRLTLSANSKILIIPDENKTPQKFHLSNIYDLGTYKDQLIEVLKRYL